MPDIREVHVTITTREDGRAHARSHEVPGLLLSAEDAQAMLPNVPGDSDDVPSPGLFARRRKADQSHQIPQCGGRRAAVRGRPGRLM